jgi:hypothetical protein
MGDAKEECGIAGGMGRNADGSVFYPFGTKRDDFWPPFPDDYVDVRTMHPEAIERSWWFNFEKGELTASWTERPGNKINLRVFRKCLLTPERFQYVDDIKEGLDHRGVEVDEDDLRMVLHSEHEWLKREAAAEITEYQQYEQVVTLPYHGEHCHLPPPPPPPPPLPPLQGIAIGKRICFYDLRPYDLIRLPVTSHLVPQSQ